jgi:hypothetical protein
MAKHRLLILLAAAIVAVAIGAFLWQRDRAARAEAELGLAASRTLSAVFERAATLKVAQLRGEVLARSESTSAFGMVRNVQTTRAPYSVGYLVDVGRLTPASYRWNADARIMSVDLPAVTVEHANVDLSRARVAQDGIYVSRRSGIAMQQQAAVRLAGAAERKANDPANVAKARDAARTAVAGLIAAPLAAAGLGEVRVVVRFPGEARPAGIPREQWDMSRSLEEVLGNRR